MLIDIKNHFINGFKNHFINNWGEPTGFSIIYIVCILIIGAVFLDVEWSRWSCSNYEEVTGKATHFIAFDACYVENSEGDMIRYDSYYKGQ